MYVCIVIVYQHYCKCIVHAQLLGRLHKAMHSHADCDDIEPCCHADDDDDIEPCCHADDDDYIEPCCHADDEDDMKPCYHADDEDDIKS